MPDQNRRDIDEWRLGLEGGEAHHPQAPSPGREPEPPNPSADRLGAPLYVVTVEHLGWAVIALYALITRLGALGLRPLSSVEASEALFARDIASRGLAMLSVEPRASGWLDPLRAGVFLAFGASDFGARIVAAIFGLLLIAAASAMRRHLGRAGALAFAAMLTLSPTLTWFSRSTSAAVPAIALVVIAIALIFALVGTSDTLMVAGLAIAIALALSAEPMVFPIAAMFVAIIILMGLGELIFRRHPDHPVARLVGAALGAVGLLRGNRHWIVGGFRVLPGTPQSPDTDPVRCDATVASGLAPRIARRPRFLSSRIRLL